MVSYKIAICGWEEKRSSVSATLYIETRLYNIRSNEPELGTTLKQCTHGKQVNYLKLFTIFISIMVFLIIECQVN